MFERHGSVGSSPEADSVQPVSMMVISGAGATVADWTSGSSRDKQAGWESGAGYG